MIPADKAIPLGLLINELVTNAAKHAYSDKSGEIQVAGEGRGAELHVMVAAQQINNLLADRFEILCRLTGGEQRGVCAQAV
jgi:two-component sensor histidine kinase